MDLMALNIQRARDHGIPPYIVWREACGLTPIRNWGQLLSIMDDDTVGRLRIAYTNLEDIDLFPGGMAEKPVIGGIVGPTFACIIAQQFLNLRQGFTKLEYRLFGSITYCFILWNFYRGPFLVREWRCAQRIYREPAKRITPIYVGPYNLR